MIGFGTLPWTVWGSSNGSAAGNGDADDKWLNIGTLVHSEGAHSWIVLQHPSNSFQICIDLNAGQFNWATVVISHDGTFGLTAGGTNGTTSARPTALNQVIMSDSTNIFSSNVTYKLHAMHSTDGECTRVLVFYANTARLFWLIDTPCNPVTGWTHPVAIFKHVDTSAVPSYANFNGTTGAKSLIGTSNTALYLTSEGYNNTMIGIGMSYADDDTGEWPLSPIGLISLTGAHRGRKGSLYDIWWGCASAGTASTYPDDASKQFVQFNDMVFPWNGTTPQIS